MRYSAAIAFSILVAVLADCTGSIPLSSHTVHLQQLADERRWLELRTALRQSDGPTLFRGLVAAALLQSADAEAALQPIVAVGTATAESRQASEALLHLFLQTGQYGKLRAILERRLSMFPGDNAITNERQSLAPFTTLPNQITAEHSAVELHHGGDLVLPLIVNGTSAEFFWDTGAATNAMSESEAKRLGLEIVSPPGTIGTITGRQAAFRAGVARQIRIGGVLLQNVSFAVLPDDQEPWSTLPLGRRGLIGVPALVAIGAFRWERTGTLRVLSTRPPPAGEPNLCFVDDHLVTAAWLRQQAVTLTLDTGALTTDLDGGFASAFPDLIAKSGTKTSREIRGVGHAERYEAIALPDITIEVGGFDATLPHPEVILRTLGTRGTVGNLGLDVLLQADAITVDFRSMRLSLEKR